MARTSITKWREEIEKMDFHIAMEALPIFRLGKTYKSDIKKLQIRIEDKAVMKDVHDILIKKGAKVKVGQPPKTELQRVLQKYLGKE